MCRLDRVRTLTFCILMLPDFLYLAGFTYDRMLHTMPDDAFDIIMKIHVRAPFRLVRAAAPFMRLKVSLCFRSSRLRESEIKYTPVFIFLYIAG